MVAVGIEQGNRKGGATAKAPCNGIDNPWEPYHFDVPNPVSKHLDALLPPEKRNNSILIFFALSTATLLDNLLNSETSWAYDDNSVTLFRSNNDDGSTPLFGIEKRIDTEAIFRDSIRKK